MALWKAEGEGLSNASARGSNCIGRFSIRRRLGHDAIDRKAANVAFVMEERARENPASPGGFGHLGWAARLGPTSESGPYL